MDARVVSLNVGRLRSMQTALGTVPTGFFKMASSIPLRAESDGFVCDEQADHESHGGPYKAIYAYASEDLNWWSRELGRDIAPGLFGENLTTEGIDLNAAHVGDRWRVGSAELRVTQPRVPCFKFAARMGDPKFPRRFAKALRTGLYLAVSVPGDIAAGDAIARTPCEDAPTILSVARDLLNASAG